MGLQRPGRLSVRKRRSSPSLERLSSDEQKKEPPKSKSHHQERPWLIMGNNKATDPQREMQGGSTRGTLVLSSPPQTRPCSIDVGADALHRLQLAQRETEGGEEQAQTCRLRLYGRVKLHDRLWRRRQLWDDSRHGICLFSRFHGHLC